MRHPRQRRGALTLALLLAAAPASAHILLREGRHRAYTRLVLALPAGATAALSPEGLLVARSANGTTLPLTPPGRLAPFAAVPSGEGLRVALPAFSLVHAWRLGNRAVFDVQEAPRPPLPPPSPPPPRPASLAFLLSPPLPLPPNLPRAAITAEPISQAQWNLPATAFARPHAPRAVPVASTPAPVVAAATLAPARRDIALPYAAAVPIAAFRRAGQLLLVAASRTPPSPALLARLRATATPLPSGMELAMPPGLTPAVEHGAWHLVAAATPPPLTPRVTNGRITLPVTAPGPVLSLRDPLHGGLLLVGTVAAPGAVAPTAVTSPWRTPFFTLLPTGAGVAVAAHADAVQLRAVASGFLLDGGPVALPLGAFNAAAAATEGARLLDLPDLPLATLRRRLTEATLAAATTPPLARGNARLRVAQALLALGMGGEARGVLRLAANADARLAANPRFKLARNAADALHPEPHAHPGPLSAAPCAVADEACLWRAVRLAAHRRDRATAAGMFAAVLPILQAYPHPLRVRLLPLAAETMVKAIDLAAARTLLAGCPRARSLRLARVMARQAALPPLAAGTGGRGAPARALDAVLARYDRLAMSRDRLLAFRAAFRAASLRAARGLATPAETVAALDRLRYAWRGDRRALALREALATARAAAGHWGRALALLRRQTRDPQIKQKLANLFARAMAADAARPMPTLQFVALVQSNPDLLPPGPSGEAILRRLAAALADLDLPDQAARVYARMLKTMPQGVPRATVGADLAAQRLAVGDARGARAALDASTLAGPLPPALLQKRTLLFARAEARLGHMPAAGAALAALGTIPALAERARLLERAGDWPAASVALRAYAAATVPPTGPLDPTAAATLIRLATAAGRAGDLALLAALRAHDLARMAPGHGADLFRMLTDPAAVSTADLPRLARTWGLLQGIAPALRAAGARLVPPAIH